MLRRPVLSDAPQLAACHLRCWRETYAGLLSTAFLDSLRVADREQMWRRLSRGPSSATCVVATVGTEMVGFTGARPSRDEPPARTIELWGLYLHSDHHGSGLGQDLLDEVLADEPASLRVAEPNPRAYAFYTRNRFHADGTHQLLSEWENMVTVRLER